MVLMDEFIPTPAAWRRTRRNFYPLLKWGFLLAAGLGPTVYPSPVSDLPFSVHGVCVASEGELEAMWAARHIRTRLAMGPGYDGGAAIDSAGASLTPLPGIGHGPAPVTPSLPDLPDLPSFPTPPGSIIPGWSGSGSGHGASTAIASLGVQGFSAAFQPFDTTPSHGLGHSHGAGGSAGGAPDGDPNSGGPGSDTGSGSGGGPGGDGPSGDGPGGDGLGGGNPPTIAGDDPGGTSPGTNPLGPGGIDDPQPPTGGDPQGFLPPGTLDNPPANPLSGSDNAPPPLTVREPMTLMLFGGGLLALGLARRRRTQPIARG